MHTRRSTVPGALTACRNNVQFFFRIPMSILLGEVWHGEELRIARPVKTKHDDSERDIKHPAAVKLHAGEISPFVLGISLGDDDVRVDAHALADATACMHLASRMGRWKEEEVAEI